MPLDDRTVEGQLSIGYLELDGGLGPYGGAHERLPYQERAIVYRALTVAGEDHCSLVTQKSYGRLGSVRWISARGAELAHTGLHAGTPRHPGYGVGPYKPCLTAVMVVTHWENT